LARVASQSTEGSATGSTEASSLTAGDVEDDAEGADDDADDDDTRPGPSCACAFTYTVPAAVPPTRTAEATKV
jgi:hypothetical protein